MRSRVELALGMVAWLALGALVWMAVGRSGGQAVGRSGGLTVSGGELRSALPELSSRPGAEALHVEFETAPDAVTHDWLGALGDAGVAVTWSGDILPVAMEAERQADPLGSFVVRVAAPDGMRLTLSDGLAKVDSVVAHGGGAVFTLRAPVESITVAAGAARLHQQIRPPDRPTAGPPAVVVFGAANWESRFVISALEEAGWTVASRITVAPGTVIGQGRALPLDTARHAVVVVLDWVTGATAGAIREFVRSGGGLVLGAAASGLDDVAPGRVGEVVRPAGGLTVPASREDLVFRPVAPREGAVVLDYRDDRGGTVAWRYGAGRVVLVGDWDTWRLAMASDAGQAEHQALWREVVALMNPRWPLRPIPEGDVAARAALTDAVGPALTFGGLSRVQTNRDLLFGILLLGALLGEWMLRRVDGAV